MSSVLSSVDERTKLVGHNRLELLLFRLNGKQRYGINVFKVREVVSCPPLTKLPNSHPAVVGVATMRGHTFTVIDLQLAVGKPGVEDPSQCAVIVAEYNRSVQGFLVPHIEHIVNKKWEEIQLPPKATGKNHYLTSVTQVDGDIVEILDVEKVLYDVTGLHFADPNQETDAVAGSGFENYYVLVADDSSVARNQVKRTLEAVGVGYFIYEDGRKALDALQYWRDHEPDTLARLALVVSDVEMPEMDGYTLTSEIRHDPALQHLKVVLHTSLSGVFNSSLLESVEADGFLSKFESEELTDIVQSHVTEFIEKKAENP